MSDYNALAAMATRLISRRGAPIAFFGSRNEAYDPSSGTVDGSMKKGSGAAIRMEYSLRDIDGDQIRNGDARFYVTVETGAPQQNDYFTFDGEQWQVISVRQLKPATVALRYEVQGRR